MERKNKLDTEVVLTEETESKQLTYDKLFWLFIAGSILGVIIEGVFCQIAKGHWESHVVSVYGSFNILYGAAAVLFYVAADKLDCKPKVEKFFGVFRCGDNIGASLRLAVKRCSRYACVEL